MRWVRFFCFRVLGGLHARFARMHIWPVTCFASNGPVLGGLVFLGFEYWEDYMLALLTCIFGP
nr:hypothetical protein [Listeria immobilis]